jgi:hypothetical protein
MRDRWAGNAPRFARRLAALFLRSSESHFFASASSFGDGLLKGFEPQPRLFFRETFGPGTEPHPRQLQQQMT